MTKKNVEAILPMTAMQEALLLRRLMQENDPGLIQVHIVLAGELDAGIFETAWQRIMDRHQSLRSFIHMPGDAAPVMIVRKSVSIELQIHDCRDMSPKETESKLEHFVSQDQTLGLDLTQAPVMRLNAFQTSSRNWHLIWTCHHALLDGWSSTIVVGEVLKTYSLLVGDEQGTGLQQPCSIQQYVRWRQAQDVSAARRFWQEYLSGITAPTLVASRTAEAEPVFRHGQVTLSDGLSGALNEAAVRHGTTQSAMIFAAWAIVLAAFTKHETTLIGATVSGRPPELPYVESLVGCLAAVVPVRATVAEETTMADLLHGLRDDSFRRQAFDFLPLSEIESLVRIPYVSRLFDSLLLIGNYPEADGGDDLLRLLDYRSNTTSAFPLTVTVIPGSPWRIHCDHNEKAFDVSPDEAVLDSLTAILDQIANCRDARVVPAASLMEHVTRGRSFEVQPPGPPGQARTADETGLHFPEDAPPRNQVELRLFRIWENLLRNSRFGVHDAFFEVGGTSLSAVRLFAQIETEFQRRLPLSTLLESPTIEQLARVVSKDDSASEWDCLVPITTTGSRPPLFCVHAGGGEVLFYRPLAERLGPDQPVYGLQPVGLDGRTRPLQSVESMASRYLGEIRTVQPHGPYFLTGHCYGTTVCLEMAQQLLRENESVAALIMLEGEAPYSKGRPRRWTLRSRFRHLVRKQLLPAIHRRWRLLRADAEECRDIYRTRVQSACLDAYDRYVAEPYPGIVRLILTEEFCTQVRDLRPEWESVCPNLVVNELPIRHYTLLVEPDIALTAAAVADAIDSAARGPGNSGLPFAQD